MTRNWILFVNPEQGLRLDTVAGLERLDWIATRYSQRPSTLLGIQNPDTAYRFDEATLLAGVFADERRAEQARAEAEDNRGRPPQRATPREHPATGAEIATGPEGMTIKGTVNVTNDRTDEEVERSNAWAVKQGYKVRSS